MSMRATARRSSWAACSPAKSTAGATSSCGPGSRGSKQENTMEVRRIGLVGYGEVGKTFSAGLKPRVQAMAAWDLKFAQEAERGRERSHAKEQGVVGCNSMRELCEASDLV